MTRRTSSASTAMAARCSSCQARQSSQSATWPSPEARPARSSCSQRQAASSRCLDRASSSADGPSSASRARVAAIAPSTRAVSTPGAASTWTRNCPARRAPSCAVSTQVATLPRSTRSSQSRDLRPHVSRSEATSSAGPSGCPCGTVCQPRIPRATASLSTSEKSRRPVWRGSSEVGSTRGESPGARRLEVGRDPVQRRLGVHVADDDQDRAVGAVMRPVERAQVVHADPRQVVGPAQDRVAVRVAEVGDGHVRLVEPPQGRVEVAGPLLGDDVPLGLDLARVERRPAHPVGLDGQRQLPAVGGEGEPVMRAVLARLGVRLPGRDERQAVDLPLGEPLGPLEQHVLDEVRQPGLARGLVHRADRVIQVADHQGGVAPGQHEGLEAVGQGPLEDRQVPHPGWQRAGRLSSGHGCPSFALWLRGRPGSAPLGRNGIRGIRGGPGQRPRPMRGFSSSQVSIVANRDGNRKRFCPPDAFPRPVRTCSARPRPAAPELARLAAAGRPADSHAFRRLPGPLVTGLISKSVTSKRSTTLSVSSGW